MDTPMATRALTKIRAGKLELWLSAQNTEREPRSLLVLMHGFGAPGSDLVPVAESLTSPLIAFPEAPINLSQLPEWGGFSSPGAAPRAWWLIDVGRIQRAVQSGHIQELVRERPTGLDEAARLAREAIGVVRRQFGLENRNICVGGFSQGAMLATELAISDPEPFGGLAIFSGTLISSDSWLPRLAERSFPVFLSHGKGDPILPFSVAEELATELQKTPDQQQPPPALHWVPFEGGHGIAPIVLTQFNAFWQQHFPSPRYS